MVRGAGKRSEGCTNSQRGALYDTAMKICKGGAKTVRGCTNSRGALYDTAKIICKGDVKTVRG